jgi:hypothetical protein
MLIKTLLIVCLLAPVFPSQFRTMARTSNELAPLLTTARARVDPAMKVYFVRGMFSPIQRQAVWEAIQQWQSVKQPRGVISFVDAGETGGLIDCQGCLTVVRENRYTNRSQRRSSFNPLRHDDLGRLASAWIGLDCDNETGSRLRESVQKALQTGLGN